MKKQNVFLLALLLMLLASAGGFTIGKSHPSNVELVITDYPEMPGLTDEAHPDTCVMWTDDDNRRHVRLAEDTHVADYILQEDIKSGKAIKVN